MAKHKCDTGSILTDNEQLVLKKFLHGIEFLDLSDEMKNRIELMSQSYIDCEARIEDNQPEICRADCPFYSMCVKSEKRPPINDPHVLLELVFKRLEETPI